jgi:hypothetical protein
MRRVLTPLVLAGFVVAALAMGPGICAASNGPLPISQTLVREGDFALRLAPELLSTTPNDEITAEDALSSVGIIPSNGWIADYPVTPAILGELRIAIAAAADAGMLTRPSDDAVKTLYQEATASGLALRVDNGSLDDDTSAQAEQYPDQTVINSYYQDEGPPVVSYYSPPSDYTYMYDWVAYPFWCDGSYFPGFFILTDFDRVVHRHHGDRDDYLHISNHRQDNDDGRTRTVTPRPSHQQALVGPNPRQNESPGTIRRGGDFGNRELPARPGRIEPRGTPRGTMRFTAPPAGVERFGSPHEVDGHEGGTGHAFNGSLNHDGGFGGNQSGGFVGGGHGGMRR